MKPQTLLIAAFATTYMHAFAQSSVNCNSNPSRPVKIVVPYPPRGGVDV